jgi:serine/threonine protein phosphatase 1
MLQTDCTRNQTACQALFLWGGKLQKIKHFGPNEFGKDFVVGDVHGCFNLLTLALESAGFNAEHDRVFSVGDLVDRGSQSADALQWLEYPWFHAVRGNHEQMAIDFNSNNWDAGNYIQNGGAWFVELSPIERARYADAFDALPIAIDIETSKGLVGIIHADCPVKKWADLEELLSDGNAETFAMRCLWSRDRIASRDCSLIHGVHTVIVGHTIVLESMKFGNVLYIDTGAFIGPSSLRAQSGFPAGKLTVMRISDVIRL